MNKLLVILVTIIFALSMESNAQRNEKATPFEKIQFIDDIPYFMYEDTWCEILKIEDVSINKFIECAKDYKPRDWKYAIVRYTHYIMDYFGIYVKDKVSVAFKCKGNVLTRDLKLKKENRDSATKFYLKNIGLNRVNREHSIVIPADYLYLNTRLDGYVKTKSNWISRDEALHDLEHLEWQIKNNYSYVNLRGFDYSLGIDAIIADLKDGISRRDFAMQIKMFMANFGDGHSRVSMKYVLTKKELGRLPFQIRKNGKEFYAVSGKEHDFYNKNFPIIKSINGFDLPYLYNIAERFIPKKTCKFVERNTLEYLNNIKFILALAGQKDIKSLDIELSNGDIAYREKIKISNYKYSPLLKRHHLKREVLDNNIGYLAFNKHMYSFEKFTNALHKSMDSLKNTNGLIIDIRGNGGGSRRPLLALLPYFIKKPVVVNVARYRIDAEKDVHPINGYLDYRFSYPESYSGFSKEEKESIKEFKKYFNPTRLISNKKYTDYHYALVSPNINETSYFYNKDVIVLVDEGCFSASDIFAAGIRLGDNVKLLGNTTGGGSGGSQKRILPNSNIKVKLSSMFSYQPDGATYDSHGVVPDFQINYTLDDRLGKTDSQLEKAISILNKK